MANKIFSLVKTYKAEFVGKEGRLIGEIWEVIGEHPALNPDAKFGISINGESPRNGATYFPDFNAAESKLLMELNMIS